MDFKWHIDTSGLDKLARNAERLHGQHRVPASELFGPDFMRRRTDYPTWADFVAASGYEGSTDEKFAAIPDREWDAFVAAHSRFANWEEMRSIAATEWASRQLGL